MIKSVTYPYIYKQRYNIIQKHVFLVSDPATDIISALPVPVFKNWAA